jgi:hypothetical protein
MVDSIPDPRHRPYSATVTGYVPGFSRDGVPQETRDEPLERDEQCSYIQTPQSLFVTAGGINNRHILLAASDT